METMVQAASHRLRWNLLVLGVASLVVAVLVAVPAEAKTLTGTKRADRIAGTSGADVIRLKAGNDRGRGRGGADRIGGAAGRDRLNGGRGADRLSGGKGGDALNAVDGVRDVRVAGGPGRNACRIDDADLEVTSGCARLKGVDPKGGGGRLELDRATGLVCDDSALACPFQLSGGGAEALVGTVTGQGGVTLALGATVSISGDLWTAAGAYRCSSDGFLRVTIGSEHLDVPVDCR